MAGGWGASLAGRTGRFGRKGISINFVHDKATWQQMEQIERQTGKQIIRIETNDLDEMEEVRFFFVFLISPRASQRRATVGGDGRRPAAANLDLPRAPSRESISAARSRLPRGPRRLGLLLGPRARRRGADDSLLDTQQMKKALK